MTDEPKEHHNRFILNQNPFFYIISLSNLMDDTFISLPKLFVDQMIKKWMTSHVKVVARLSKLIKWGK